jgi:hypothetical protein
MANDRRGTDGFSYFMMDTRGCHPKRCDPKRCDPKRCHPNRDLQAAC